MCVCVWRYHVTSLLHHHYIIITSSSHHHHIDHSKHILITWVSLLIFLHVAIGTQELGERSVIVNELSVAPHFCDLAVNHHHNMVTLGEEAYAVGHQDTRLCVQWEREVKTGIIVAIINQKIFASDK